MTAAYRLNGSHYQERIPGGVEAPEHFGPDTKRIAKATSVNRFIIHRLEEEHQLRDRLIEGKNEARALTPNAPK